MSIADKIALDFQRFMDEAKAAQPARTAQLQELQNQLGVDISDSPQLNSSISLAVFAEDDEVHIIREKRPSPSKTTIHDEAYPESVPVAEAALEEIFEFTK